MGSPRRHSSFLSLFLPSSTYSTFQKGDNWDFNKSYAIGGENFFPSFAHLPIAVSHSRLSFIDSHEIGPGKLLAPSDLNSSSNAGAIAGGIAGGVAVISILAVAVFLYWRRRRSLAVSAGDDVVITHMDQIQGPKSGQKEIASSFPGTTTPLMKPYVRVIVFPIPLVCAHSSS